VKDVLLLSHSHPYGPFRVGSHHYARELARTGVRVVHLSTPVSLAHRATGRVNATTSSSIPYGPRVDQDDVTTVVPRTVLPRPYGRFRVADELARLDLPTRFDAVLIDQPLLWDASVRALAPRLAYRPTDTYPTGVKARLQKDILAHADGVVATSNEVLRALGPVTLPSLVLENGVEIARFESRRTAPRPDVCVYVGALDHRFDWSQVSAWATAHPDLRFDIVGPDPAPPTALPSNVVLHGAVPYGRVPGMLHAARVGLLPLSDDPLNAGRSPMKLYEYLAAGLAVVTRETPVLHSDATAGVYGYRASDGADSAEAALRRALAHASPNTPGVTRARTASWPAKTAALMRFLTTLPAGRRMH